MKAFLGSVLLICLWAPQALAQPYRTDLSFSAYTFGNGFTDGQQSLTVSNAAGAQQQSRTAVGTSTGTVWVAGRADTYVQAQAGSIRSSSTAYSAAQSSAQGFVGTAFASAESRAFAQVVDRGVFSIAGVADGTVVTITAFLGVSGSLTADASGPFGTGGQAIINWFGQMGAGFANGGATLTSDGMQQTGSQLQTGVFFFSADVTLGADVDIRYGTGTQAFASANLSCSATCPNLSGESHIMADFASTLTWGGISQARLADGALVDLSRLSMQSASGFNYISPSTTVPEPGSFALLATALVALGLGLGLRRGVRSTGDSPCESWADNQRDGGGTSAPGDGLRIPS